VAGTEGDAQPSTLTLHTNPNPETYILIPRCSNALTPLERRVWPLDGSIREEGAMLT